MANPYGFPDTYGEWFEVLNVSDVALDLAGVTMTNNHGEFFVVENLIIQPGQYAVLGLHLIHL